MSRTLRIISEPTMTRAPPVAQGGMDANMGAKKTEMKKRRPVTIAVMPVLPPSGSWIRTSVYLRRHCIRTGDSGGTLNECCDRTCSYECTHGNRECIDAVCNSRIFEVKSNWVTKASKFNHRVKSTSCILTERYVNRSSCHLENDSPRMST